MDDQRLEEIAKRAAEATIATLFSLPATEARFRSHLEESAYRAIREALASQEEELGKVQEELRSMLRERRAAETASCQGYEATVARAEAAETEITECRRKRVGDSEIIGREMCRADKAQAELHRLREGMRGLQRYTCDCLPNDPTNTRMATDEEAAHADVLSCQRFVVLDADVDRLLASSVEEKPESAQKDEPC
jgi:hypothetical protein